MLKIKSMSALFECAQIYEWEIVYLQQAFVISSAKKSSFPY